MFTVAGCSIQKNLKWMERIMALLKDETPIRISLGDAFLPSNIVHHKNFRFFNRQIPKKKSSHWHPGKGGGIPKHYPHPPKKKKHMSSVQNPGWLFDIRDEILPNYMGIIS